jgi:hypothetical protein
MNLITAYFELLAIPVLQVAVYDLDPGKANVSRKLHRFYIGLQYATFSRKPKERIWRIKYTHRLVYGLAIHNCGASFCLLLWENKVIYYNNFLVYVKVH